jgi:metal-sulfur cluster biosynthetic enzyme
MKKFGIRFLFIVLIIGLSWGGYFYQIIKRVVFTRANSSFDRVDKNALVEVLEGIQDPELGVDIVNLGLIRDIIIDERKNVRIRLIFTSPFCPYNYYIRRSTYQRLSDLPGIGEVKVFVDDSEIWDPEMITEKGKLWLKENSH